MADDTQKSIFSAFGETPQAPAASAAPAPEQQPPTPSNQGAGGSIFSALTPEAQEKPVSFGSSEPPAKQQSGSIFSAFDKETVDSMDKPHQVEAKESLPDPDAPWYKKVWDWANSPVVDEQHIERWLGREGNAGGFEKGLYDLISGLTSPLQIALTLGTFGSGSLLESGGAAALKAAGMGAEEISTVAKGSQVIAKAIKMGRSADEAYAIMPGMGINPSTVLNGLDTMAKGGLKAESIIATGLVRRAGGAMLRSAGVGIGDADKISNWVQFAVDAGFTAQNAYGAAVASPRVLDAIKEGDYESAKRLAIDALGSGAFAALGGRSAFKHAGELMSDVGAKAGLHVVPSEENLKLIREFEPYQRDINIASEEAKNWERDVRTRYKDLSPEGMQLARMRREAGSDETLAKWHNYVAETAGRDERVDETPKPVDLRSMDSEARHEWVNKNAGFVTAGSNTAEATASAKQLFPNREFSLNPYIDKDGVVKYGLKLGKPSEEKFSTTASTVAPESFLKRVGDAKGADPKTIAELKAKHETGQGHTIPPVEITLDEDGNVTGADGRHRASAALQAKVERIPVNIRRKLPATDASEAIEDRLKELVDQKKLEGKPKEYVDKLLASLDPSKLTERHTAFAREAGEFFDKTLERAVEHEALSEGSENYVTRVWKKPDNETIRKFRALSQGSGFSVNTSMARHRIYGSTIEGLLRGEELADHDMVALAAHNHNEFGRIVAARQTVARILDKGTRASDGRPMAARAGTGHTIEGEEGENPGVIIRPSNMGSVRMADKVVQGLKQNIVKPGEGGNPPVTELSKLMKEGKIIAYGTDKQTGKALYAWTTHDYKTVDNASFRGWKVAAQDTSGSPVIVNGEVKVHPEAHEYLNRRLGTQESIVKKVPGLKTVLAAGREAKGLLLFVSPFHVIQEGLRAVMTGISPFSMEKFNANDPMHILAAEKGVWEGKDYRGVSAFEDGMMGHSKLLGKAPGLRQLQSKLQTFLFDRYIPSLKLRSFRSLFDRYKEAYPEWTKDKAAEVAASDTNERFGGISYKRMGRSAGTMDAARLLALAPDWLESEVRFMARMFGDEGKLARRDVAKMSLYMWGAARVLNYLTTGQAHNEAPFGVAYRDDEGREKVYSLRTMPTDMLHAASDPAGFLKGRVSPLMRVAAQTYTGRDEFGRKIPEHGVFVNLLRNVSPIPVQSAVKYATGENPEISVSDSAVKAAGFTVFPYRTEAQKKAAQLASEKSEAGPVDPAKLRRHQTIIEVEGRVREGKVPLSDVYHMVEQGVLHTDEAKAIIKNAKDTQGMDNEMARLYSHATRLPLSDLIGVWNDATNEEKAALSQLLIKKKQAYLKKVNKDMSASERSTDPTYLWIRKNFPSEPPW